MVKKCNEIKNVFKRKDLIAFYEFQILILNVDFLKILLEKGSETQD